MGAHFLAKRTRSAMSTGGNQNTPANSTVKYIAVLYKGNPGEAGTANKAEETTTKAIEMEHAGTSPGAVFSNLKTAVSWVEVKKKETYTHIGVWNEAGTEFLYWIELEAPVAVEIGDTFKLESVFLEILAE